MMGADSSCVSCDSSVNPSGNVRLNPGEIYHERQSKELCALHALNNLFQDPNAFSKQYMDEICYSLSPSKFINPHKSMLGLGNYDVNVVMAAIQTKNCETVWFDKRKSIQNLNLKKIFGFILNIPTDYKLGIIHLPMQRKHWIAIRKIREQYYNLDSKLDAPVAIGDMKKVRKYLQDQVSCPEKELLLVVTKEVSAAGEWFKTETDSQKSDSKGKKHNYGDDSHIDNNHVSIETNSNSNAVVNFKNRPEEYDSKHSAYTNNGIIKTQSNHQI